MEEEKELLLRVKDVTFCTMEACNYFTTKFVSTQLHNRILPPVQLYNITAKTVSDKFTSLILEFGIPQEIVDDFGTQYTSEEFRKRCSDSSIKLTFSAPHHHQANSVAERAVGTVKQLWKKAQAAGQCPGTAI